jgi:PPP family 3-phenylpropionic acid transporter
METQRYSKVVPMIAIFVANGLVYGLNCLYSNFLQIYLSAYHNTVMLGILLSVGPFVAMIAPVFWGFRADKAKYKNTVLAAAVAGAGISFFMIMTGKTFLWHFVVLIFVMFFMSPFGGLIDIITLEYSSESGMAYGPARLMGTLVWGVIPIILAPFTKISINVVFFVYIILAAICVTAVLLMPKVKGHAAGNNKISIKPIIKDFKLMMIIVTIAVSQFCFAYYTNFFPLYLRNELKLPEWVWGINVFLTVACEIPFFLLFKKIYTKLNPKVLLLGAVILSVARYIGLAVFTSIPMIFLNALITGFAVTVFVYCGSVYINNNMSPDIKGSCQSLIYAAGLGIPKVSAGLFGGIMTNKIGVPNSMLVCFGLSLIMVAAYVFYHRSFNVQK